MKIYIIFKLDRDECQFCDKQYNETEEIAFKSKREANKELKKLNKRIDEWNDDEDDDEGISYEIRAINFVE